MKQDIYELLNDSKKNGELDEFIAANFMKTLEHNEYTIIEDNDNYFIDVNTGFGFGQYPKADFTLKKAILDQETMFE